MKQPNPYVQIGNVYFIAMIFLFFGWRLGMTATPVGFTLFGMLYMWVPGVVALINARQEGITLHFWSWPRLSWLPWLALPLLLAVGATALSALFVGYEGVEGLRYFFARIVGGAAAAALTPKELWFLAFIVTLVSGVTINFVAASGEELFWRGYLWHHLSHRGFWISSWIIGAAWALWHWPLIIFFGYGYPGHPLLGCAVMTLFCLALSPLLAMARRQGGAVALVALCHGLVNATPWLWMELLPPSDSLLVGLSGLSGLLLLGMANLLLYMYLQRNGRLRYQASY